MQRTRDRLTHPATLISILALCVALVGTAIAGQRHSGKSVTRKQVVALVRKLSNRQITIRAPGLSVADARTAADALALAGRGADSYASSQLEPVHFVGAPGEPSFENGWSNASSDEGRVGFWKDPLGLVHLRGLPAKNGEGSEPVFTLLPSFRPGDVVSIAAGGGGRRGEVTIESNGEVKAFCEGALICFPRLDGTAFRRS